MVTYRMVTYRMVTCQMVRRMIHHGYAQNLIFVTLLSQNNKRQGEENTACGW